MRMSELGGGLIKQDHFYHQFYYGPIVEMLETSKVGLLVYGCYTGGFAPLEHYLRAVAH